MGMERMPSAESSIDLLQNIERMLCGDILSRHEACWKSLKMASFNVPDELGVSQVEPQDKQVGRRLVGVESLDLDPMMNVDELSDFYYDLSGDVV